MSYFAEGREVEPSRITPELVLIEKSDSLEGYIFRAATLLWSVPVSRGYGRRMRYLVIDKQNEKLVGIFALGDPVFNLKCRDNWIGWNVNQRRQNLVCVLDAYVLGSIPPYSFILGGKLIGSLLAVEEIRRAFRDYLHLVGIGHILAAPFHPQTNGKVERYQQSLKREVNQIPYEAPSQLDKAIADFVDYYNYRRYHKALGDVTPADVLYGRREQILQRRKEVRIQTINHRRNYNRGLRELVNAA